MNAHLADLKAAHSTAREVEQEAKRCLTSCGPALTAVLEVCSVGRRLSRSRSWSREDTARLRQLATGARLAVLDTRAAVEEVVGAAAAAADDAWVRIQEAEDPD